MIIELFAGTQRFEISSEAWHQARELAKKSGWKPQGTVLPGDKTWTGIYSRPHCQFINARDCANLCEALVAASDPPACVIELVVFLSRAAGERVWIY